MALCIFWQRLRGFVRYLSLQWLELAINPQTKDDIQYLPEGGDDECSCILAVPVSQSTPIQQPTIEPLATPTSSPTNDLIVCTIVLDNGPTTTWLNERRVRTWRFSGFAGQTERSPCYGVLCHVCTNLCGGGHVAMIRNGKRDLDASFPCCPLSACIFIPLSCGIQYRADLASAYDVILSMSPC